MTVPVLMLRGAESDLVLPEVVQQMRGRGPGAAGWLQTIEVPGCGHAPALNVPAQLDARWVVLIAEGVPPSRRLALEPRQVAEAVQLYVDGWSLAKIADRFSVRPTSIYYWLRKNEVTLRPRPGWTTSADVDAT